MDPKNEADILRNGAGDLWFDDGIANGALWFDDGKRIAPRLYWLLKLELGFSHAYCMQMAMGETE